MTWLIVNAVFFLQYMLEKERDGRESERKSRRGRGTGRIEGAAKVEKFSKCLFFSYDICAIF